MKTPKQAGLFMLLWLLFQFAAPYLLRGAAELLRLAGYGGMSVTSALAFIQIFGNIVPVIVAYAILKRHGGGFIPFSKLEPRKVFYSIIIALSVQPAGMLVSYISFLAGFNTGATDNIRGMAEGASLPVTIAVFAFLPALTEELVCRGAVLSGFRSVRPLKAALINGFIFGIMHMNLRQFFYAFALGVVISLVVIYGGSVVYGIIIHFIINAVQTVPAYPVGNTDADVSALSLFLLAYALVLVLSTVIFIAAFKSFKKCCKIPEITNADKVFSWPIALFAAIGVMSMFSEYL